jgi:DNA-binding NtrC family response regulator
MSPHERESEGALGVSHAMREVEMLLRGVAEIDSSLLITGESGVGKEVAAKFVHQISTRANEPFVAVNCGAIPNDLIESQLFGHEKGPFTSAQARHHGFVERARNGILFLDEVGELPMLMQVKLLRLIQERTFTRVGGETAIKTGARIICATNSDPGRVKTCARQESVEPCFLYCLLRIPVASTFGFQIDQIEKNFLRAN